ncbi:MAG: restriction endonuclease subunit M [Gammaproteobacteria bacterium]
MTAEQLFRRALCDALPREIAAKIGLNVNTVHRWIEQQHVPESYRGDFLRLLGMQYQGGTARDKDQFFTKPAIAARCFRRFCAVAKTLGVDLDAYYFIEPSAGDGGFYNLLPPRRRIGIDVDPPAGEIFIKQDYLTWQPKRHGQPRPGRRYAVIGNPPFGLRGHLALQFINHSRKFADLVGFILPPLFDSDGKGVPGKRVRGFQLAHTEQMPSDAFAYPDGRPVNVSAIFQVWSQIGAEKIQRARRHTCAEFIKVYSLSDGGTPASTRNKKMLHACDIYMPSTCFSGMTLYRDFESLPHRRGYGLVIHKRKRGIMQLLKKTDWSKAAFTSTNGALNLRASLIEKVVVEGGFYDGK